MTKTKQDIEALGGLLTLAQVATRMGVGYSTVTSERRRGRFPEPDSIVLGRPLWRPATIDTHHAARPGSGNWGGRRVAAK